MTIVIVNPGHVFYLRYAARPWNPGLVLPHSGTRAFIWGMETNSQASGSPTDCCPDILIAFKRHQGSRLFSRQGFIAHAVGAARKTLTLGFLEELYGKVCTEMEGGGGWGRGNEISKQKSQGAERRCFPGG